MVCLTCARPARGSLCEGCRLLLRPGSEQFLSHVGTVRAAFRHSGPARQLVHHLKYRGVVRAGWVLAEEMARNLEESASLVPVRRVGWRRLRYGVDPAVELAKMLGKLTGCPVVDALTAPFWGRPRAGRAHGFAPRFRLRHPVPPRPLLLVDDVMTTGSTLISAAASLPGVAGAITATTAMVIARSPGTELTSLPFGGTRREP